jgi:L-serine dehydratase
MRRIVAAPTAGSCGMLPAVLLTYADQINAEEDKIVEAL